MSNEADTRRRYVLPKLYEAGWKDDQVSEQKYFTDGRIVRREAQPTTDQDEIRDGGSLRRGRPLGVARLAPLTVNHAQPIIRMTYVSGVTMHKKLTITVDENVYEGLHRVIGRQRISQFIETLVRPHVVSKDLLDAYREMASDERREAEAADWAEATVSDVADETR